MDGELLALPKRYITKWLVSLAVGYRVFFPPRSLGLLSVLPPASPGGEMGVGKQNAGGDLGLHGLPTSSWEFLKTPFNPASPKGSFWVRNNDGKYRGKWGPLFPP